MHATSKLYLMFELQQEDWTLSKIVSFFMWQWKHWHCLIPQARKLTNYSKKKKRHVISELITSWMRPNRWTAFSARDWCSTQRQQVSANTVYWICGDGVELWYCPLLTQWSCVAVERAKDLSDRSCKWTLFSPQHQTGLLPCLISALGWHGRDVQHAR